MTSLKIAVGFGLALALSLMLGIMSFGNAKRFLKSADLLDQRRQALELQQEFSQQFLEAEMSVLSFLITGKESALDPEVQARLTQKCERLKALCEDEPLQVHRIDNVRSLTLRKLKILQQFVVLRQKEGKEKAVASFSADKTAWIDVQIRKALGDFQHQEQMRLQEQLEAVRKTTKTSLIQIFVRSASTFILLLAAGVLILRDVAWRREAEQTLATERNLLRSLVDTIPDQVYVKDHKGRYILDNAAHRKFLGLKKFEEIEGKSLFELLPRQVAKEIAEQEQSVLKTDKPLKNHESLATDAEGKEVWLSTSKVPFRGLDQKIVGLVCVSADISERKQSEETLRVLAAQLEQSNRELQDFASVASHDLQEPLRKIQAFAQRLRDSCTASLGALGLQYLERIESATSRMQVLIQDLLTLSRVTSCAAPFVPVNLSHIVREVLSDLEVAVEKSGAKVEVGDLPVVPADPLQMRQLFQNLISNALKFRKADVAPVIRVSSEVLPMEQGAPVQYCEITIADNGIGFAPEEADKIFKVFHRLHGRAEYEGTGIGLSVVRKIIDRHGGAIVARSALGQGATFNLKLPLE